MISVKNVTKYFGQFQALKDISFHIAQGEIVGFLGQNGAGKTTLMRILTTYLPPTSGEARIGGYDVTRQSLNVRRKIGYLPENPPLYPNMTVKDYLKFAARLKSVPAHQQNLGVEKALFECSLLEVSNKTIGTLSKGYKQRVGIAQAIINDPPLLILDEPTTGLDPVQIMQVRRLIKSFESRITVILSTHILSEIEQIAKRVLIIREGQIIADAPLNELLLDKETNKNQSLEQAFLKLTGNTVLSHE